MACRKRSAVLARCLTSIIALTVTASAATADETLTYSYDALGRLVKVARAGTVNNNATECYAYDPASNRSNITVSTTADCLGSGFSIGNGSATEGAVVNFTVTRTGPNTGTDTVQYSTGTTGSATSGVDYTAIGTPQTLTFGPGIATQTVSVSTIQDALVEGNETFNVNLSSPSAGATISDGQGLGTIVDDDTMTTGPCSGVSFSVGAASAVTEGGIFSFPITKTGTATGSCSVNYTTQDGSATAGSDYTAKSGAMTFSSAQTSLSVSVPTIDDTVVENPELVFLSISNATGGATINGSLNSGTINDNDVGNHAPIANSYSTQISACGSANVDVVRDAGDSDPDGDPISVTGVTNVTKGSATFSGTVVSFSTQFVTGTASLTYTISDSHGATASNTMSFTISGGVCP